MGEQDGRFQRHVQPSGGLSSLTGGTGMPTASSSRSTWQQSSDPASSNTISPRASVTPTQPGSGWPSADTRASRPSNQLQASYYDAGAPAYGPSTSTSASYDTASNAVQLPSSSNSTRHRDDRGYTSASPTLSSNIASAAASQRYRTADGQPLVPFKNLPIPSHVQVHDYLVRYQKIPQGLNSQWSIAGHHFDLYTLFNLIVQMGGSHRVTSHDAWPHVGAMTGFPVVRDTPQGPRSSPDIGDQLRKVFNVYLGGLEALWDKTKAADSLMSMEQSAQQSQGQGRTSANVQGQSHNASASGSSHRQSTASWAENQLPTPVTATASSSRDIGHASRPHVHPTQTSQNDQIYHPIPSQPAVKSIANLLSEPSVRPGPSTSSSSQVSRVQGSDFSSRGPSPRQKPPEAPGYVPPTVTTFEDLVLRSILPLPKIGAEVAVPSLDPVAMYAWRAHELRVEIRKMTINETHRHLSMDELMFWSKLLAILKRNPTVLIPKPSSSLGAGIAGDLSGAQNSGQSLPSAPATASSSNGVEPAIDPPSASTSRAKGDKAQSGKRRGRPSKSKSNGELHDPASSEGTHRPKPHTVSSNILVTEPGSSLGSAKPRGRPPKLDENGNRIKKPRKKKDTAPATVAIQEDPDSQNGNPAPGADNNGTASSSHQIPAPVPTRPTITPAADFLRHLQAQQGGAQLHSTNSTLPTSINPALLHHAKTTASPVPPVTPPPPNQTSSSQPPPAPESSQPADEPGVTEAPAVAAVATPPDPDPKTDQPDKKVKPKADPNAPIGPKKRGRPPKVPRSYPDITYLGSTSPKTMINLSGSSISKARMRHSDASTPTKIVGPRPKRERDGTPKPVLTDDDVALQRQAAIDLNIEPDTLAAALAQVSASSETLADAMAQAPAGEPSSNTPTTKKARTVNKLTPRKSELFIELVSRRLGSSSASQAPVKVEKTQKTVAIRKRLSHPVRQSRSSFTTQRHTRSRSHSVSSPLRPRRAATPILRRRSTRSPASGGTPMYRSSPLARLVADARPKRQHRASLLSGATPTGRKVEQTTRSKPKKARHLGADKVKVVIDITRQRRKRLIQKGYFDSFRDDDSDEDDTRRPSYLSLRPMKPLPRYSIARTARPTEPEAIPLRFLHRPGPAVLEPFASILTEKSLLNRVNEHICGWKGCDSVLASEVLLERHVKLRDHLDQARFAAGTWGRDFLWRCRWKGCEEPCFSSKEDLRQHVKARHVSRNLKCPFIGCDLTSPSLSHLTRHVMKQHDDEPDNLAPMADLSEHIPPSPRPPAELVLPEFARADELTTPLVSGSTYPSHFRREWAKARVANNCFGGENPVMHVEHPPHILEVLDDPYDSDGDSDTTDYLDAATVREERLADKAFGRPTRRFEPVVLLEPKTKRSRRAEREERAARYIDDDDESGEEYDEDDTGDATASAIDFELIEQPSNEDDSQPAIDDDDDFEIIEPAGEDVHIMEEEMINGDTDLLDIPDADGLMGDVGNEIAHWDESDFENARNIIDALDAADAAQAATLLEEMEVEIEEAVAQPSEAEEERITEFGAEAAIDTEDDQVVPEGTNTAVEETAALPTEATLEVAPTTDIDDGANAVEEETVQPSIEATDEATDEQPIDTPELEALPVADGTTATPFATVEPVMNVDVEVEQDKLPESSTANAPSPEVVGSVVEVDKSPSQRVRPTIDVV